MKTKNKSRLLLVLLIIGLGACQKSEIPVQNTEKQYTTIGNLLINNTIEHEYQSRIALKNDLIPLKKRSKSFKSTTSASSIDPTKNYTFKLKAEVASPVYNQSVLQATHVVIKDNWAFVTYNTRGDVWLGGFEIFDISNVSSPALIASTIMPVGDISAIDYNNGKLYLVGATGDFEARGYTSPAFLEVLTLDNTMNVQSIDTIIDIPSYVGTDVKVTNEHIIVTSGSTGGLIALKKSNFSQVNYSEFDNARALDVNNSGLFLLQGQEGRISKLSSTSFNITSTFNIGGATIPGSKSELAVSDSYILAALNDDGLRMLTMDGQLKQHIPAPETPVGALEENHVTNSVTLNDDLVLLGNGESGLYVGGIIEQFNDSIWEMGTMQFEDGLSANFVDSKDSIIVIASGMEGLKILAISVDNGVPDDITPTEPCESLLDDLDIALPESVVLKDAHPELFQDTVYHSIHVTEETDLYLVFIDEGAGYKNSFGYYSYPTDEPPSSVDQIEKHLIFPNASKVNSGGGLEFGDMVKIGDGKFKAGTSISFFLVSNGWQNGATTDGYYTLYTNPLFNPNKEQQSILFINSGCNDLVIGIEDIRLTQPDCDFDYNDIIFTVKDNPDIENQNTRIKVDKVPIQ